MALPRCVCLTAPTASGKTELALEIAAQLPVEIISMDSAMVYRGMDIGTAKPSLQQRAAVVHHLIDICDPVEAYSAGRFVADVGRLVAEISARGRLPLIVGGTMMYLRALRSGLAALPRASNEIRARIDAEAAALGWASLHAKLAAIDPASAARIAPADRQRIQRALEVWYVSGETLSALQRAHAGSAAFELCTIAVLPQDRAALRDAIERRFDAMLAAGLVEELRLLRGRHDLHPDLPAMRCVGYRQIWACLEGRCTLAQARSEAITATRRLAKRQLTWLRSDPGDHVLAGAATAVRRQVFERVAEAGGY